MPIQAMVESLEAIDRQFFLLLHKYHNPVWNWIMYWIGHNAVWLPLYGYIVYKIFIPLKRKTLITLVAISILITLSDQFSSALVKPWVRRLRPCCNLQIQDMIHVVGKYKGVYGFISSHAANSFALAMFVWLLLRRSWQYSYILFFWASVISYSRIYGGVHYPADILFGALSGLFWAYFIHRGYIWIEKFIN